MTENDDKTPQKWKTCLLDPPWAEIGGGKIVRGAQKHYKTLKTSDMPAVIIGSGRFNPEKDAHMYMWTTSNFLKDALWLIEQFGFEYKTNIIWAKTKIGIGRYFRGKHEQLLFATKGKGFNVRTEHNDIPSLIQAAHVRKNGKIKHSAKPEEFYQLIERRSHGPYMEFFARQPRKNWTSWGNEL